MTVSAAMTSSRLYESGTTNFLETGGRGPTLAMLVMLCSPAAVAAAVATGKVEAAAKKKVDVGGSKDEAVKAPTRTVVARPRLPAAMAAAPKPPKVVPPRSDATYVARRVIGGPTAGRIYAADVKGGGILPMSALRPRRRDAAVATDAALSVCGGQYVSHSSSNTVDTIPSGNIMQFLFIILIDKLPLHSRRDWSKEYGGAVRCRMGRLIVLVYWSIGASSVLLLFSHVILHDTLLCKCRFLLNGSVGGTLLMSAPYRKNKLRWRCRTTTVMMFWAEWGEGSWLAR